MSVNPGFGGQSFIPSSLEKISQLRKLIDGQNKNIQLAVDGGVKVDNIAAIAKAGARQFIAGSAIFGQPDYSSVIQALRSEISKGIS